MTGSDPQAGKAERLHALDAVRGFALLLGIFYHAALSFLPFASRFWMVADSHSSDALSILVFASHSFRMTTFFVIAGFFAHLSYHRLGPEGFIRDRAKRIALPLLVGWPVVTLAFGLIVAVVTLIIHHGHLPPPPSPSAVLSKLTLTHLWFLYVLLEFYVVILLLRAAVAAVDRSGRIRAGIDRAIAALAASPWASVALGVPTAAAILADPVWTTLPQVQTPEHLVTNLQAWVAYGTAFGFGYLLHRQAPLIWRLQRHWALHLALAAGSIAACLWLAGVPASADAPDLLRITRAASYAIAGWAATFAVIGAALQFWSGYSAARRYVADASYWLYLVHLPMVVAMQIAVARLDWPWPVKYAIVMVVVLAIGFASYQTLVRYGRIGAVLNGPRTRPLRRPSRVAPAEQL